MPSVSVVVITYNEEKNIERCLRSLSWCDDVIVVDSFSSDRTTTLAAPHCSRIVQHAYDGDILQRQRGFALAKHEWLLYVDADEEVSGELRDEILSVTKSPDANDGYYLPRKVSILGRWITNGGWSPDYSFRLFRRSRFVAEAAEVHGGFSVPGSKGCLRSELYHYTYPSFEEYLRKMNDYTSLQISNKLADEISGAAKFVKILFSPPSHFFRKYIVQRGYNDGMLGFFLAALGGVYTLALYTKLWEFAYFAKTSDTGPPITNLELHRVKARYKSASGSS